jgi:hypothetical protein
MADDHDDLFFLSGSIDIDRSQLQHERERKLPTNPENDQRRPDHCSHIRHRSNDPHSLQSSSWLVGGVGAAN